MRKTLIPVIVAGLIAAPAQARDPAVDVGPGAFFGARMKISLGGKTPAKAHASLAIAPTRGSVSSDGMVRTRIGEGFALEFAPGAKPTLTLAGVRADYALGLQPGKRIDPDQIQGVSTTGWVAIGVGTVLVAGLVGYGILLNEAMKNTE